MAKAAHVLAALKRDGWMGTRRSGSHRVLAKGDQQRVWAYHDGVDLGGPAMARIARDYGYTAAVLAGQKEFRRTTPESSGPVLADAGFPGDRLEHPGGRGMRPGGACLAGWLAGEYEVVISPQRGLRRVSPALAVHDARGVRQLPHPISRLCVAFAPPGSTWRTARISVQEVSRRHELVLPATLTVTAASHL